MNALSPDKSLSGSGGGRGGGGSRWPWILALVVVAIILAILLWSWGGKSPETAQGSKKLSQTQGAKQGTSETQGKSEAPPPPPPSPGGKVVEVKPTPSARVSGSIKSEPADEQAQRKKPYGLDKSLDAVVRSDESIKVGGRTVKVSELERKLVVEQRGELLDRPLKGRKISAWGVHLVRPGENLWDIHYALLREYLASRGIKLPPHADRPDAQGRSSGVGKILKFAEHMVGVYNLKTGRMSADLNHLEPGRKVVVFNLTEIFQQLAKIDPHNLSGVMYDGRVLLFPEPDGKTKVVPEPPVKKPAGE